VAFGIQRPEHLGDLRQAFRAAEDGADDLAGVFASTAADRAVALGLPSFRQVWNLDSVVVGANPQAVVLQGALRRRRFDLYLMRSSALSRLCGVPYYAEQLNSVLQLRGFSSGLLRIILGLEAGQWDPL
jgi:hypothetical protein